MKSFLENQITNPLVIVEDIALDSAGKLVMRGKVQQTTVNQNNREYPKELWEYLFEDPDYLDKLKRGTLIGGIGHPKDGIFEPEKGCLVTRQMELNGESVNGDLEVITKHPHGMILECYYRSGVYLPVSSRGRGDSSVLESGVIRVLPQTFVYEGHDAVIEPSVKDACPEYVSEALRKKDVFIKWADLVREKAESDKIDVEFIRSVRRLAPKTFAMHEGVSSYRQLGSLMESRETELTGEGTATGKTTYVIEYDKLAEAIAKKMKEESTQENPVDINQKQKLIGMSDGKEKTVAQLTEEVSALQTKLSATESTTKLASTQEKLDTAKKLVEAQAGKINGIQTALTESTKKYQVLETRHVACSKLAEAGIAKSKALAAELAEAKADIETLSNIILEQSKKIEESNKIGIKHHIKAAVEKFPTTLRKHAMEALSVARTRDDVNRISESLSSFAVGFNNPTLPFQNQIEKKEEKAPVRQESSNPLASVIARRQKETGVIK